MTVAANDILRVVASLLWTDGNVNQNVFNCKVTGGSPPYEDSDIADDMEDWLDNMYANMVQHASDEIDGNEVLVYKWDDVGGDWDEVQTQSWIWDPDRIDDQLPRGVAGLVRLWTEDPDVQGKKYLGGLTEDLVEDGLLNASTLVAMLAFAADWYAPFVGSATAANFTPGVWSVVGKVFEAAVDHIAANAIPAYQRRRKRNVGI